jgi:recombinational DNA repair protein (RecF pathway)
MKYHIYTSRANFDQPECYECGKPVKINRKRLYGEEFLCDECFELKKLNEKPVLIKEKE